MTKIFFASDHHLGHTKLLTFVSKDPPYNRLRSFNSIEEHDRTIIEAHNSVVEDDDLVYFLGDVTWKSNRKAVEQLQSMKGRKRLTVGNHDDVNFLMSTGLFEKVYLWKYFPEYNLIASHVPLSGVDATRTDINVHGHIHERSVIKTGHANLGSFNKNHYFNVSMEALIDYKPVNLDTILESIK